MMVEDNTSTIRLVRPPLLVDVLRSYRILVNGKEAGKIANNSTLETRVAAGPVTIEARLDWVRSEPLTIHAVPGQTLEVEVRNHWGTSRALWAISFGRNTYLLLTPRPAGVRA
jgi:hypothetical protein